MPTCQAATSLVIKISNKFQRKTLPLMAGISLFAILLLTSPHILNVNAAVDCGSVSDCEKKQAEIQAKLDTANNLLNQTLNSINQLSSQLTVTVAELNTVQANINTVKGNLDEINQNLADRNQKLSDKILIRNTLLRNYSKKNIVSDLELFFTRNENFSGFQLSTYVYAFNKAANEDTVNMISALNAEIKTFEQNKAEAETLKKNLETAQSNLVALQRDLDAKKATAQAQATALDQKTTQYEKDLEALQSKILNLKYGDETGSVGDYEQPGSKTPDAPFKPAFAAFSYGAYTHNNGMSQYGAKGRADSGQSYTDILKFYYKVGMTKPSNFPTSIAFRVMAR